jgi:hypothetical protein
VNVVGAVNRDAPQAGSEPSAPGEYWYRSYSHRTSLPRSKYSVRLAGNAASGASKPVHVTPSSVHGPAISVPVRPRAGAPSSTVTSESCERRTRAVKPSKGDAGRFQASRYVAEGPLKFSANCRYASSAGTAGPVPAKRYGADPGGSR